MANIGAEVGQKMRSAIKAKLLELSCYVDDELPDYVMVMVANKRTKSQMKEDLHLFLGEKTPSFVDWLHIVLKKLKEVTVTNPDVLKKATKRKSDEIPNVHVKKEKKNKKTERKVTKVEPDTASPTETNFTSLTDDLPICANKLSEQRKIIIMKETQQAAEVIQDNFDIPPLSAVTMSTEEELEDIEKQIKNVKSRLGLLVESDEEADYINLKAEPDELFATSQKREKHDKTEAAPQVNSPKTPKQPERTRITFSSEEVDPPKKRRSVLERLGKRGTSDTETSAESSKKRRSIFTDNHSTEKAGKEKSKPKESVLNRLGVMSKVSVPSKLPEEPEEPFKNREVASIVKIKPRTIPSDAPQANKNLLLKAVADAQRSIAQAPPVGSSIKLDALYTKKYKEKLREKHTSKKLPEIEKNKIKKILSTNAEESHVQYIPTPIRKSPAESEPVYNPSKKIVDSPEKEETDKTKQQFIVTLDGIDKNTFKDSTDDLAKKSVKSRLDKRKSPSPIIFDTVSEPIKAKINVPNKLPIVHTSTSVKNKERCKYWPSCRHGEKCEFVHPIANCEKFPHCKFGDKCLYLHPSCKFGSACTRRNCAYSHSPQAKAVQSPPGKIVGTPMQTCKFFPSCTNPKCTFYHPKPCKFGKYCKHPTECNYSHTFIPNKGNLTWRSK